jgi:hypothetical protein
MTSVKTTPSTGGYRWLSNNFNGSYPSFYTTGTVNSTIGETNALSAYGTPLTIFVVAKYDGLVSSGNTFVFDSTNRIAMNGPINTQGVATPGLAVGTTSGSTMNQDPFPAGGFGGGGPGPFIQSVVLSEGAAGCFVFTNGSSVLVRSPLGGPFTTTSLTTPATFGNVVRIGSRFAAGSSWFGKISEVLFYNNVLSNAERQQVEGYLAAKWGMRSLLPATHPYSNTYPAILPRLRNFQPTDVSSSCLLWFDGRDYTTLTLSGSNVTAWRDKSENANNITSFSATQPTYNSSTGILTFSNGTGTTTNNATLTSNTAYSIFYIVTFPSGLTDTGSSVFSRVFSQTDNTFFFSINRASYTPPGNSNVVYNIEGNIGSGPSFSFANNQGFNTYAGNTFVISMIQTGTTTYRLSVNGNAATGSGTATMANKQVVIGSAGAGLGELLFYNGTLSTQDTMRVEGYLMWKWGIQRTAYPGANANIKSDHPFYRFPTPMTTPFVATFLGNTHMWYDGADTSSLILSGSTITLWNDKSGNGNHLTVAAGPTRTATTSNPAGWDVSFNGSTQYIRSNALAVTNGTNTMTVFIVVKNTTSATLGRIISGIINGPETNENGAFQFANAGTNSMAITKGNSTSNGQDGTSYTISSDVYHIINITWNGATNSRIFVDGSLISTYSANSNTTFSFTRFGLGASLGTTATSFAPATFWTGSLNEVIIYRSAISSIQRQQVEGYLAWKWGLQASLPTSHPYYKVRP